MPAKTTSNYQCPRCLYQTRLKGDIRRHFYRLKTPCYSSLTNLTLTDDIKEYVLSNRTYGLPMELSDSSSQNNSIQSNPISQVVNHSKIINIQNNSNITNSNVVNNNVKNLVNNFQLIQNIVLKMDPIDKVKHLLNYNQQELIEYDSFLENLFSSRVIKMQDPKNTFDHSLTKDKLIECVNEATYLNGKMNNFNVFYQKDSKRIKIYQDGQWTNYLEDSGVCRIIELLRYNYLNDYELYLLRKIHDTSSDRKIWTSERLETYYKFLCAFDMIPHAEQCTDIFILGKTIKSDNPNYIEDYAFKVYNEIKKNTKPTDKREFRKIILNVIKSNTIENLKEINMTLTNLLHMDHEYKDNILPQMLNRQTLVDSCQLITL